MGASTTDEVAPAYEEVFRQPSTRPAGYTRVAFDDAEELDLERDSHQHDASLSAELGQPNTDGKPHTHCEECDRQLDRRERRKSKEHCCTMLARTFMSITLFLVIFGIVAVLSTTRSH
ncbi:uncharacterized protein N7482_005736 [Penicillium canariense]|uniref:Transmembrane protein n=1 Tax=Penicillium canariense TaxID=189055 RepID=A0A9W9I5G1_9EURO|nr:uncharacterized protein N7482_005736 [Penicillium canariense]KAJ5166955.1 hypothetical protein N7482_005736 [Penicillium canariense]